MQSFSCFIWCKLRGFSPPCVSVVLVSSACICVNLWSRQEGMDGVGNFCCKLIWPLHEAGTNSGWSGHLGRMQVGGRPERGPLCSEQAMAPAVRLLERW